MLIEFFLAFLTLHKAWHDVLKLIQQKELLKNPLMSCGSLFCYYLTQSPLESELQFTVCYYTTQVL